MPKLVKDNLGEKIIVKEEQLEELKVKEKKCLR